MRARGLKLVRSKEVDARRRSRPMRARGLKQRLDCDVLEYLSGRAPCGRVG